MKEELVIENRQLGKIYFHLNNQILRSWWKQVSIFSIVLAANLVYSSLLIEGMSQCSYVMGFHH